MALAGASSWKLVRLGPLLSLCRVHFQAVVRATCTAECASDDWLDKFTAPVGPGHVEPSDPLSIGKMIKHASGKVQYMSDGYALLIAIVPATHSASTAPLKR